MKSTNHRWKIGVIDWADGNICLYGDIIHSMTDLFCSGWADETSLRNKYELQLCQLCGQRELDYKFTKSKNRSKQKQKQEGEEEKEINNDWRSEKFSKIFILQEKTNKTTIHSVLYLS